MHVVAPFVSGKVLACQKNLSALVTLTPVFLSSLVGVYVFDVLIESVFGLVRATRAPASWTLKGVWATVIVDCRNVAPQVRISAEFLRANSTLVGLRLVVDHADVSGQEWFAGEFEATVLTRETLFFRQVHVVDVVLEISAPGEPFRTTAESGTLVHRGNRLCIDQRGFCNGAVILTV